MEYSCLTERDGDAIKRAWKHFYATELPFAGYRKIPPAMVTPGFGRDVILDIFNRIPENVNPNPGEKPQKNSNSIKSWIAKIAENQRQTYRTKRKTAFLSNAIIWVEITVIIVMLIVWALRSLL